MQLVVVELKQKLHNKGAWVQNLFCMSAKIICVCPITMSDFYNIYFVQVKIPCSITFLSHSLSLKDCLASKFYKLSSLFVLLDSSIISTDTLPSIGSSTESDTEPEATSSSDLLRVSSEATSELAGGSVTDSILQPPADNSILILGVVIPIILVLLVALVVVAVLSFFYAKHVRRSHKIQTKTTPGWLVIATGA